MSLKASPLSYGAFVTKNAITLIFFCLGVGLAQENIVPGVNKLFDPELRYVKYIPSGTDRVVSRSKYLDKLHGFDHQKLQNCFEGSKRRVQKGIVLGETWIWLICYIFRADV